MAYFSRRLQPWLEHALIASFGGPVAYHLEQLDYDDKKDDGGEHHIGLVAVITIHDGQLSKAAAAHSTRHGRVAENSDSSHSASVE